MKTEGEAGKMGQVSLIGASNKKETARRAGARDKQWEEGCNKTGKGVARRDKEKTGLNGRRTSFPAWASSPEEDAPTEDRKSSMNSMLGRRWRMRSAQRRTCF